MPHLQPNVIFAGRYTLLEKLGIGGYSEVWKATDNMAGEMLVALKIFAPEKGLDQTGIQVFSKEYGLVFNLNHTNLLKPSYFDIWEGSPFLVMSYCKNGSLYGKIGEMNETEVLKFIQQAADALDYLHSQPTPIIHQDIKPDNFLINDSGNFLLSDFGISSRLRRTLTRSIGNIGSSGTMAYLPPERFSEDKQILPAGDIFALGVTIYELLTGDLPFDDQGGLRLRNGAGIPKLPSNFTSGMNDLVRSCLNITPALRPDAKELKIKASELFDSVKTELPASSPNKPLSDVRKTAQIPDTNKPSNPEAQVKEPISQNEVPRIPKKNIIIALAIIIFIILLTYFANNPLSIEEIKSYYTTITNAPGAIESQVTLDTIASIQSPIETQPEKQKPTAQETKSADRNLNEAQQNNYSDKSENEKVDQYEFYIGQTYAGGIIFFIDGSKLHGLIAAPSDLRNGIWGCYELSISGTSSSIFAGAANTKTITRYCDKPDIAADICSDLVLNGYSDWFLPSKSELNLMYQLKDEIGDFTTGFYWSSSEEDMSYAWGQFFLNGKQDTYLKYSILYIRAIRSF
jgi:serine/threonine protein kinase